MTPNTTRLARLLLFFLAGGAAASPAAARAASAASGCCCAACRCCSCSSAAAAAAEEASEAAASEAASESAAAALASCSCRRLWCRMASPLLMPLLPPLLLPAASDADCTGAPPWARCSGTRSARAAHRLGRAWKQLEHVGEGAAPSCSKLIVGTPLCRQCWSAGRLPVVCLVQMDAWAVNVQHLGARMSHFTAQHPFAQRQRVACAGGPFLP